MTFNRAGTRKAAVAFAVSAALAAMSAGAADPASKPNSAASNKPDLDNPANPKFEKLDLDKDGFLSRQEVRSLNYGKAFGVADANKDGKLDRAEFTNAESVHARMAAGSYVEDTVITTKVKTALLKEKNLKSTDVSVETQNGVVLLSGFVRDEGQKERAVKAASTVTGVASVKDSLVVRQN
jgi:hyperosmotically inducible protein